MPTWPKRMIAYVKNLLLIRHLDTLPSVKFKYQPTSVLNINIKHWLTSESALYLFIPTFSLWAEVVLRELVDPWTVSVKQRKWSWAPRGRQRLTWEHRTNPTSWNVEAPRPIQRETPDSQVQTDSWHILMSWILGIPLLKITLRFCLPHRCQLGAHEHNGDDGLRGFTLPRRTARITWFGPTPLSGGCGGRLLLWTLSYDHNEQRLAQAGNTVKP